ncbi:hypothetical protein [Anaerovibrio sp. JC8]|uniref:hypothetical protein n=1 Tax=Anaerovibrio sp. JC8 TaxID=1240085 RepID=UPI000A0F6703|nr:hypothetical protein [Anaerovibrio sp. JC8]
MLISIYERNKEFLRQLAKNTVSLPDKIKHQIDHQIDHQIAEYAKLRLAEFDAQVAAIDPELAAEFAAMDADDDYK